VPVSNIFVPVSNIFVPVSNIFVPVCVPTSNIHGTLMGAHTHAVNDCQGPMPTRQAALQQHIVKLGCIAFSAS
jgi:hypothetical protein